MPQTEHPGDEDLPPALQALLERDVEGTEGALIEVVLAGVNSLSELSRIDLSDHEDPDPSTADLAIWEEVAPAFAELFGDIRRFVDLVRSRLPAPPETVDLDDDAAFDAMFGETPVPLDGPAESDPAASTVSVVHGIVSSIEAALGEMQQNMRRPEIMADRWNLLGCLGAFHGRFIAGIREIIYVSAITFGSARKERLIPGLRRDIDEAVRLRQGLAVLSGQIGRVNRRLDQGVLAGHGAAEEALGRVNAFLETDAWRLLRPLDKKALIGCRVSLTEALGTEQAAPGRQAVEGLDKFLESLTVINHREALRLHDAAVVEELRFALEVVVSLANAENLGDARFHLDTSLRLARSLLGIDRRVDRFLVRTRRFDCAEASRNDVLALARNLERCVEALGRDS